MFHFPLSQGIVLRGTWTAPATASIRQALGTTTSQPIRADGSTGPTDVVSGTRLLLRVLAVTVGRLLLLMSDASSGMLLPLSLGMILPEECMLALSQNGDGPRARSLPRWKDDQAGLLLKWVSTVPGMRESRSSAHVFAPGDPGVPPACALQRPQEIAST